MTDHRPHHEILSRSTRIKVAVGVYIITLLPALLCMRLMAPIIEERFSPVIDAATDRAYNIHMEGMSLCWNSLFFKRRVARPIQVSWTLIIKGNSGALATYIGVAPKRISGDFAPDVNFVDLSADQPHNIEWCVALPAKDFSMVTVVANWEYQTHGLANQQQDDEISSTPWWSWNVHQGRAPVIYRPPQ